MNVTDTGLHKIPRSRTRLGGRLTRRNSAAGSGASSRRRLTRSRRITPRPERFGNLPASRVSSSLLVVCAAVRTIPIRIQLACSRLIRSAEGALKELSGFDSQPQLIDRTQGGAAHAQQTAIADIQPQGRHVQGLLPPKSYSTSLSTAVTSSWMCEMCVE